MTPEQIAADRITRAVAPSLCVTVGNRCPDAGDCKGCRHAADLVGRCAVVDISAAGLVIMTAERAAEMLDALTAAAGWIANERREIVECHTVPDANGGGDESTMDDGAKKAVAEIDTILGRIAAVMWRAEDA